MLDKFKLSPSMVFGILANIITIVLGLIGIWKGVESHIESITVSQTQIIATLMANDFRTRLNLYESYVDELKSSNKEVPTLLLFNIKSLEDQLEDLKDWNNEG